MRSASNGMVYFLISDAINYVVNKNSKILNGDVYGVVDDSLFLGSLSLGTEVTKTDKLLYDTFSSVIQNEKLLYTLTDSVIVSSGRILADYIDSNVSNQYAHYLRHPTLLFRN